MIYHDTRYVRGSAWLPDEEVEQDEDYLTVPQAAKELQTTRQTLYKAIKANRIPHIRVNKDARIPRSYIVEQLNKLYQ